MPGTGTGTDQLEAAQTASPPQEADQPLPQCPGASSSSSWDEAVKIVSDFPPEDYKAHQKLLKRMPLVLDIQAEEVCERSHRLVDILASVGTSRVALTVNEAILKPVKMLWQTSPSVLPMAQWAEMRYYVPLKGFDHIYSHPPPAFWWWQQLVSRRGRVTKCRCWIVRNQRGWTWLVVNFYLTGGLQLRFSNQRVFLSCYDFALWEEIIHFKDRLPEYSRQEFTLMLESKVVARIALQYSLDAADSAAHSMASAISVRWCLWLQSSGLLPEVHQTIQVLPFEGPSLFSEKTDDRLHSSQDSRATMKSLGM